MQGQLHAGRQQIPRQTTKQTDSQTNRQSDRQIAKPTEAES